MQFFNKDILFIMIIPPYFSHSLSQIGNAAKQVSQFTLKSKLEISVNHKILLLVVDQQLNFILLIILSVKWVQSVHLLLIILSKGYWAWKSCFLWGIFLFVWLVGWFGILNVSMCFAYVRGWGSSWECQAAMAQEWPRGATPLPRSGAAAGKSYPTPKEWWLSGRRRHYRSYSTFKVRRGGGEEIPLVQGKRNPSKMVGVARGCQRAETLKP